MEVRSRVALDIKNQEHLTGFQRVEPTETLLASLDAASQNLESAAPVEILQWAVENYAPNFAMATAFGPEGMTMIHMLSTFAPETPIFNLETGYQFQETLELREKVKQRYGIEVQLVRPELDVVEYEQLHGGPVYKSDPNKCCYDIKLSLLKKVANRLHCWSSAIRRDQSPDRAKAPIVGWDKKFGLIKVSPLANCSKKDIWNMILEHDIPYKTLHDQGYPSVGCWPCTRPIGIGEDERAGRWSGTAKTECGLHSMED
ncbi:MAG TPA: phosphoadenylyl-sulfate reductase [Planctomycetaceae bacterium]|nr:phosphoadenylyl-sulfate reductase [Planctomycetaceae bacterium]